MPTTSRPPIALVLLAAALLAAAVIALPPPPARAQVLHSGTGSRATQVASRLHTPTAFSFGAGRTFVADAGSQDGNNTGGGVYVLARGHVRRYQDRQPPRTGSPGGAEPCM